MPPLVTWSYIIHFPCNNQWDKYIFYLYVILDVVCPQSPLISCIVGYLLFFTDQTTPTCICILLMSFTLFPWCQELREVNLQWLVFVEVMNFWKRILHTHMLYVEKWVINIMNFHQHQLSKPLSHVSQKDGWIHDSPGKALSGNFVT